MKRRLGIAAACALFAYVTLGAQTTTPAPQRPTFRANTETVEVDVSVTDSTGRPIRGLTREDFAIPGQTIVAFQEVNRSTPDDPSHAAMLRVPHDVADNQSARSATLVLLVLDDQVPAAERERARVMARDVVDRLGDGVQIGLLSTSGRLSFEMTDDRSRLLAAIDRVNWSGSQVTTRTSRVVTGSCNFALLEEAARLLAPMPAQRKAIVAVTPGCGSDITGAVRSMASLPEMDLAGAAVRMVDVMRRANVAYYSIDPRGVAGFSLGHLPVPSVMGHLPSEPEGRFQASDQNTFYQLRNMQPPSSPMTGDRMRPTTYSLRHYDPVVISQENLDALGATTGGFAVTNTNDLDSGINRLVDDFDHYYVLGFTPTAKHSGFEKIGVTVNRPNAVLRYRKGYETEGVQPPSKARAPLPSITGVMPVADVPLRLMAMPFVNRAGASSELLAIEVRAPRELLTAAGGALADDASVTVVAVRSDQARVEQSFAFKRHVVIAPAFANGSDATVAYQIVREIALPPGHYQLRVSVTSAKLASTGSVYLSTDVPDTTAQSFDISGPMLVYADPKRVPAATTLIDAGLPALAPVFDRVFVSSDTLRVYCPILRKGGMPSTALLELINADGVVVVSSNNAIGASDVALDATLKLAGVPAGPYRLRVTASQGEVTAKREIGIGIK